MSFEEPTPTRWRAALSTFERLQDLEASQRHANLESLRRDQPELHALVLTLLKADSQAEAHEDYLAPAALPSATEWKAGETVGPYRLEHPLGQGGMGEVWRARRADGVFDHPVALKLLHPHLARSSAARDRFVREGRILGELAHPNIARLLDAGVTPAGQLYLALEYIEGDRLDRWCDTHCLGIDERLQLVQKVCSALTHAHAHLVVHRDVKPSNILVTIEGEVKLLDFGIAKLVEDETGSGQTELTHLGGRVLTPEYAAPEQVAGGTITVATDVYALGVLLYALLSGRRPYGPRSATPAQVEHAVLETDPPLVSQARALDTDDPRLESVAQSRGTTPRKLTESLRGDLDVIVGRALKKKPEERYPSIVALSEDLRRYLDHEPVLARPDSLAYRARKYFRRHRVAVSATAAVTLAIVAGAGIALWQAREAREQAARAENESARALSEAGRAKATKDFLLSVFGASDPSIASDRPRGSITARELLDVSAKRIEADFGDQPELQIELLGLAADIYSKLGEDDRQLAVSQRHVELARARYGERDPIVINALMLNVDLLLTRLEYPQALAALSEIDRLLDSSDQDVRLLRAKWWRYRAAALNATPDATQERIEAQERALALFAELAPHSSDYGVTLGESAFPKLVSGDLAGGRARLEKSVAVLETATDRSDDNLQRGLGNLARVLEQMGDHEAADKAYTRGAEIGRKTIGAQHPDVMLTLAYHARMWHRAGDRERAHALFDELLQLMPSAQEVNTMTALSMEAYAACLAAEGRARESLPLLESAHRLSVEKPNASHDLRRIRQILGDAYDRAGRTADARRMLKASRDEFMGKNALDLRTALASRERWARFLLDHSTPGDADRAAAEAEFRVVVEQAADKPWLAPALAHAGLARIAAAGGDTATSLRESQRALDAVDRVAPSYDLRMQPYLWRTHSAALLGTGDDAGARDWAQKALEASRHYDVPGAESIVQAEAALRAATNASGVKNPS